MADEVTEALVTAGLMNETAKEMARIVSKKMEEVFSTVPPGWILCVHEEYNTLYEDSDEMTYRIEQQFHIIRNSDQCLVRTRKTQYGPKV